MAGELTAWLRGRSDAELTRLLAIRPELATPAPGDAAVLAARATVRVSVLRALELIDRPTLQVLELLVILGGSGTSADLAALLPGASLEHVEARLERLRELALGYDDGAEFVVVKTAREILVDHLAGTGRPARRLVDLQSSDRLNSLETLFGLPLATTRDGRLDALAAAYEQGAPASLLEGLDEAELAVLRRLDEGGAVGTLPGATRVIDDGSPVRRLLSLGLLLAIDPDTVELPREIGLLLRGEAPVGPALLDPPLPGGKLVDPAAADSTGAGQAAETVRLTEALLELMASAPATSLRAGGLSVRDLRRVARGLDTDEATASLLLETVFAAGLLDRSADPEPLWLPTPAYDSWLGRDVAGRWTLLVTAWLATPRAPGSVGERDAATSKVVAALGPDASRPAAALFRRETLRLLQDQPVGTPLSVEDALAALDWRAPRRVSRIRDAAVGWALAEAASLGITGRGALTTAGRLLLDGELDAATSALDRGLPEPVHTVLLQADLTAVAPGRLAPEVARELSLAADLESSGAASVFRFSDASLRRALDAGLSGDEVHAFLERIAATPVPQTLTYLVDDVARRHGVLRAGAAGSYLRCDDTALLAEVVNAKATHGLGLRWLAPTVAIAEVSPQQLLEGLRSAGFSPAIEGAGGLLTLTRETSRRTPHRARVSRVEAPTLSPLQVERAVAQLREGDAAAVAGRRVMGPLDRVRDGGSAPRVSDQTLEATVALLGEAVRDRQPLIINYIDPTGRLTERYIEPRALENGNLYAFDERARVSRTFAVRNIAEVRKAS